MALADFTDYQRAQQQISKAYADREKFVRMSLMNISGAGVFSADRSIMDYANLIWHTKPVQFPKAEPKAEKKAPAKKTESKAEKKASAKKAEPKAEKKAPAKKAEPKAEKKAPAKSKAKSKK